MMLAKNLMVFLIISTLAVDTRTQSMGPAIIKGRNLDNITPQEQSLFVEISEDICARYWTRNMERRKNCDPVYISPKVGGKVGTIEEFPHMALVGRTKIDTSGYEWICGGSLISDQHVLTAAQCMFPGSRPDLVSGPPRAVQLGGTYVDEAEALVVPISIIILHPKYKPPIVYHDIALIKMAMKVTFTDKIQPACLGIPPAVGETVIATGWEATKMKNAPLRDLRAVMLPIWDIEECKMAYRDFLNRDFGGPSNDSQVCAGERRQGIDTCLGDAGGPIQIQDGCTWRVVGVMSFGTSCGLPQFPGIYATASMDFIVPIVFGTQQPNYTLRYFDTDKQKMTTHKPTYNNNVQQPNGSIKKVTDSKPEIKGTGNENIKDNRQTSGIKDDSNVNDQQTTSAVDGNLESNVKATISGYANTMNNKQTSDGGNGKTLDNQQITGASIGSTINNQPATGVENGNLNNVLQTTVSSYINNQQTIGTKDSNLQTSVPSYGNLMNNQQATDCSTGNVLNGQPATGSHKNLHARINTKLREDSNVINRLDIDIPINSSLEIDTEINKNRFWTNIRINKTAIVHTVEIQIPE